MRIQGTTNTQNFTKANDNCIWGYNKRSCTPKRRVTSVRGHSSGNTTIFVFYLIYQLHVSAIVNSAIIRLDTIVRETIRYNVIQYNLQCQCK
jgi:hypothetical protein